MFVADQGVHGVMVLPFLSFDSAWAGGLSIQFENWP